jgi:hypothetical protein
VNAFHWHDKAQVKQGNQDERAGKENLDDLPFASIH